MNKHLSIILISLWITFCTGVANGADLPPTLDDAIDLLRVTLSQKDKFLKQRQARIDSLTQLLSSDPKLNVDLYGDISHEYRTYCVDSAIHYLSLGMDAAQLTGDKANYYKYKSLRSSLYVRGGAVTEALDEFDSIDPDDIPEDVLKYYYLSGNNLFFYLATTYPTAEARKQFAQRGLTYTERLIEIVPKDHEWYKYHVAELHYLKGEMPMMVADVMDILETTPMESNTFARAANMLGGYYDADPDRADNALYYKILAAISDIRFATREETSLNGVGISLFKRNGDIDLAYDCLLKSLDDAVVSGANINAIQTARSLPIIALAFREHDQRKINMMTWLVLALVIALGVIIAILLYLRKEVRSLNQMRARLHDANMQKEAFINQFLNLCSIYMEKMEEFSRVSSRKLKAGQVDDLYQLIKSGKMLEEANDLFCEVFDKAFIKIFPTFVEGVNSLLQPDKQIHLRDDELLNTELRILAFMRLGIEDSAKIARFLDLSLNTIYTYRNKLKTKAISRETFEKSVMLIAQLS